MKVKNKIKIHSDDIKLFTYLYIFQVATINQIRRDLFPKRDITSVVRRLSKLKKNGFLEKKVCFDSDWDCVVYSTTKKVFKNYLRHFHIEGRPEQMSSASLAHDLTLIEIRKRLKQFKEVSNYYTENLIRSSTLVEESFPVEDLRDLRNDAVFKLEYQQKFHHIALEYEASIKDRQRYSDKFLNYCLRDKVSGVFFVCKKKQHLKKIMQFEKDCCGPYAPKFYYIVLEDLLCEKSFATFYNRNGNKITLHVKIQPENQVVNHSYQ